MIFSERDMAVLRLTALCQFIRYPELRRICSGAELKNLAAAGLIKAHAKSSSLVLTGTGKSLLSELFDLNIKEMAQSYHEHIVQRRIRLSPLVLTAYQAYINVFAASPEELAAPSSLFLPWRTRGKGRNPWGSTRIAALAHLGDTFYALHYVCPDIGRLALTDELIAFTNHTARFPNAKRAFLFAGKSYGDILTELERPMSDTDGKLIFYGDAYRYLNLPVHLLSCDDTGAVQLQIMAAPGYRNRLTRAALKGQYRPPPKDIPVWDAIFQGMPFVMAADMDLRRLDAAVQAAKDAGLDRIAIAALEGQAEEVLFPRYRDTGLARVFTLTPEAISEVTGRPPTPYVPPRTQFLTSKGDVIDAPPIQANRKTGK